MLAAGRAIDHPGSVGRRAGSVSRWRDESALTLVELLVAIVILGILFSAVAGALINFSQVALNNERRVQATGFMSGAQEQLQTINWELAALYDSEVMELQTNPPDPPVDGFDPSDLTRFDGEDLVIIAGPADDPREDDLVPQPFVDDGTFETFTFVTLAEDIGDGATVKRFTTVVRWKVFGRTIEQSFESLRAPTLSDVDFAGPPFVQLFDVSPTNIQIDATTRLTTQSASIVAVFSRGVNDATIEYTPVDSTGAPMASDVVISLDEDPTTMVDGAYRRWTGVLPANSGPFPDTADPAFVDPEVDLRLIGTTTSPVEEATSSRTLTFSSAAGGDAPSVSNVTVSRTAVQLRRVGGSPRLCNELVVEARVDGLDSDGFVTMTFTGDDGGSGLSLSPVGTVTGSNDLFRRTFPTNTSPPWDLSSADDDLQVKFNVTASNPDGPPSEIEESDNVTILAPVSGGNPCP